MCVKCTMWLGAIGECGEVFFFFFFARGYNRGGEAAERCVGGGGTWRFFVITGRRRS